MKPIITLVVAMNKDNVIGVDNQLPWHIPEDLKYFKQVTLGKPILMGRKTFDSIGRVLPGRANIVITRDQAWQHAGVEVFNCVEKALKSLESQCEVCVIGGGEIFNLLLPLADKLHVTIVDVEVTKPTAFFPQIDYTKWQQVVKHEIISQNNIKCSFNEYIRAGL